MILDELKKELYSGSSQAEFAAETLAAIGSDEAKAILFEAILSSQVHARNTAAWFVREAKLQEAVPHLVKAIMAPENRDRRGNLVYALTELDCGDLFLFLFQLALEGNYECRCIATDILWEQRFWISEDDLLVAEGLLADWKRSQSVREDDELLFNDLGQLIADLKGQA